VNKDLVPDVLLDSASLLNDFEKLLASALIVGVMSIYYIDQCTAFLNVLDRVTLEHVIAWEVNHVELDVIIVTHCLSFNCARGEQEESLVR